MTAISPPTPSPQVMRSPEEEARLAILMDRFFNPKPGDRCIFDNNGGWPYQQQEAAKKLTLDAEYTVSKVEIYSAHTRIWLEGQGDGYHSDWFNNMMFRPAAAPSPQVQGDGGKGTEGEQHVRS